MVSRGHVFLPVVPKIVRSRTRRGKYREIVERFRTYAPKKRFARIFYATGPPPPRHPPAAAPPGETILITGRTQRARARIFTTKSYAYYRNLRPIIVRFTRRLFVPLIVSVNELFSPNNRRQKNARNNDDDSRKLLRIGRGSIVTGNYGRNWFTCGTMSYGVSVTSKYVFP